MVRRHMPYDLSGKAIAITGASSGIGEATALACAAAGASVALGARRSERIEELASRIEGDGGRAVALATDVADERQARAFVVNAYSEALRQEALDSNIRVTIVEPGFVETELQSHNVKNEMVMQAMERARE